VKSRFTQTTLVVGLVLAATGVSIARGQTPIQPQPAADPNQATDLQAIRYRLEQQDAELRQLRAQLGTLQSQPHALPPVGDRAQVSSTGDVIPASAISPGPAAASPEVFELRDRLTSLEKRLDASDADAKAPKGYEVGSDLKMSATWKNGVQIQSANKDFRMHVGGRTQFDICMFDNDPALVVPTAVGGIGPQPDSLDIRRGRLRVDGTMYETVDWVVEYEFANLVSTPTANVQSPATTNPAFTEVDMTWTQLPVLGNFRVGNFKEPIGFEHLQSDSYLPFMERSYLQDFVFGPFNGGYTPGLAFFNWTESQNATWGIGFFGNNDDNFGFSLGNDYALTGRVTWLPVYDEPSDGRYLWHLGVAGSARGADENIVRLRTRGDIRSGPPGVLNPIYADTKNMAADVQDIIAAETAFVYGPFSVVGEYVGTWVDRLDGTTPYFQGGYIQCGYFLTGEHEVYDRHRGTFDRVTPYENAFCVRTCDGHCKGWGAWQILARYNTLDLNALNVNGGSLDSFTLGVIWFWNANARMYLNYDFTSRGPVNQVAHGDINALGLRFGYDF
jgi:phosphate-selective porin OprO/OprP